VGAISYRRDEEPIYLSTLQKPDVAIFFLQRLITVAHYKGVSCFNGCVFCASDHRGKEGVCYI
jgi:hypothetical protein